MEFIRYVGLKLDRAQVSLLIKIPRFQIFTKSKEILSTSTSRSSPWTDFYSRNKIKSMHVTWRDTAPWKSRAHGDSRGFLGGFKYRNDRDTIACHDNNTCENMGDNGSLEVHRGSWNSWRNEGERKVGRGWRILTKITERLPGHGLSIFSFDAVCIYEWYPPFINIISRWEFRIFLLNIKRFICLGLLFRLVS